MVRGRVPEYVWYLEPRTIVELALYRDLCMPDSSRMVLPTLETVLRRREVADSVAQFIEAELQPLTGRQVRFRSLEAIRRFCGPDGVLDQIRVDGASLLASVFFPERADEPIYSPVTFDHVLLTFPLGLGTFQHYAACMAAILERFYSSPAASFRNGWISFSHSIDSPTPNKDWAGSLERLSKPYSRRSTISGQTWMEVYREWFHEPHIGDKGLAARARRGRRILEEQPKLRFVGLTLRSKGRAPRTLSDLGDRIAKRRGFVWCERWKAQGSPSFLVRELSGGPAIAADFSVRECFAITG